MAGRSRKPGTPPGRRRPVAAEPRTSCHQYSHPPKKSNNHSLKIDEHGHVLMTMILWPIYIYIWYFCEFVSSSHLSPPPLGLPGFWKDLPSRLPLKGLPKKNRRPKTHIKIWVVVEPPIWKIKIVKIGSFPHGSRWTSQPPNGQPSPSSERDICCIHDLAWHRDWVQPSPCCCSNIASWVASGWAKDLEIIIRYIGIYLYLLPPIPIFFRVEDE